MTTVFGNTKRLKIALTGISAFIMYYYIGELWENDSVPTFIYDIIPKTKRLEEKGEIHEDK